MNIILLGPPGAGKGTQAAKIVKKFEVQHISTGDILRQNIKEKTELGMKAQEYMDKGELVPDKLIVELMVDKISKIDQSFMLDGFPRTILQAEELDKYLNNSSKKIDCVLDIEVDSHLLIERATGRRVCANCGATYHVKNNPPKNEGICDICGNKLSQRKDDTEETVNNRIEVYLKQTKPLIDYYKNQNNLFEIDGSKTTDEVFGAISKILEGEK